MRTGHTTSSVALLRRRSWSWVLRNIVLPLGGAMFGQNVAGRLHFLQQAQWWDRDQLAARRNELLAELVRVSYDEVPFYRTLIDAAGVKPKDFRAPEDLAKLPVVTKDMLRAAYPHRTVRSTGFSTYEASSSGSTGRNFCVLEDSQTAGWYRASFLLVLDWAGWQLGEPHMQTGITPNRSLDRWLKDALLRCYYVSAYDLTDSSLDQALEVLDRHRIQHLWGYPGSLYCLAKRAMETGWNIPLQSIVTWGDNLYAQYRSAIQQAFKARILDSYGCGEGMQIAAQCSASASYHIHSLDVIVEFVDGSGQQAAPTDTGNIVVTRLHPGPMPLIRYQVGDVGVRGSNPDCECGRGFETINSIQGRDTDIIVTPSGNRLIVHFFTGVLEHFPEIASFQVRQNKEDSITLCIVPGHGFSADTPQRIVAALKERGAADLSIEIELVEVIPAAASGKRRFVVSTLPRPFSRDND